jgi:hypothetical protein
MPPKAKFWVMCGMYRESFIVHRHYSEHKARQSLAKRRKESERQPLLRYWIVRVSEVKE